MGAGRHGHAARRAADHDPEDRAREQRGHALARGADERAATPPGAPGGGTSGRGKAARPGRLRTSGGSEVRGRWLDGPERDQAGQMLSGAGSGRARRARSGPCRRAHRRRGRPGRRDRRPRDRGARPARPDGGAGLHRQPRARAGRWRRARLRQPGARAADQPADPRRHHHRDRHARLRCHLQGHARAGRQDQGVQGGRHLGLCADRRHPRAPGADAHRPHPRRHRLRRGDHRGRRDLGLGARLRL